MSKCPTEIMSFSGDAHSIQRLLSILLENASKYTPPGGSVRLRVRLLRNRASLSPCTTPVLELPPEQKRRIFDRFYRAAPAG